MAFQISKSKEKNPYDNQLDEIIESSESLKRQIVKLQQDPKLKDNKFSQDIINKGILESDVIRRKFTDLKQAIPLIIKVQNQKTITQKKEPVNLSNRQVQMRKILYNLEHIQILVSGMSRIIRDSEKNFTEIIINDIDIDKNTKFSDGFKIMLQFSKIMLNEWNQLEISKNEKIYEQFKLINSLCQDLNQIVETSKVKTKNKSGLLNSIFTLFSANSKQIRINDAETQFSRKIETLTKTILNLRKIIYNYSS